MLNQGRSGRHPFWTFLFALSVVGFCSAFVINAVTWVPVDISALTGPTVVVFAGVFVVWFPTLLALSRKYGQAAGAPRGLRIILRGTPQWLYVVLGVIAIYVFVNFFASMTGLPGQPESANGQYFFDVHGSHQLITRARYLEGLRLQLRIFSGHPMVFYLVAALGLRGVRRQNGDLVRAARTEQAAG